MLHNAAVRRPVIIDLDELHMNDPLYLVEYGREIHSYLKNLEVIAASVC